MVLMMIKCSRCDGRKYVLAFGGVREDCPECGGSGFVDEPASANDDCVVREVVKERRKPGPKSKKRLEA